MFYLRHVAPPEVKTLDIYRSAVPHIAIQIAALVTLALVPDLATKLPEMLYK